MIPCRFQNTAVKCKILSVDSIDSKESNFRTFMHLGEFKYTQAGEGVNIYKVYILMAAAVWAYLKKMHHETIVQYNFDWMPKL